MITTGHEISCSLRDDWNVVGKRACSCVIKPIFSNENILVRVNPRTSEVFVKLHNSNVEARIGRFGSNGLGITAAQNLISPCSINGLAAFQIFEYQEPMTFRS